MNTTNRALSALTLAGALVASAEAGKPRLPFSCYTNEWNETLKIVSASYDARTSTVTWELEAK